MLTKAFCHPLLVLRAIATVITIFGMVVVTCIEGSNGLLHHVLTTSIWQVIARKWTHNLTKHLVSCLQLQEIIQYR